MVIERLFRPVCREYQKDISGGTTTEAGLAMDSTRQPLAVKAPHGRPHVSRAYLGNLTSRLIIS